jgi:flagellar motor switch protein FliM
MQTNNPDTARAIIERISARPRLMPERMPVLNAIVERLAVVATEFLRRFCAPQMVFLASPLAIGKSSDLLEADKDGIASVFAVPEWDGNVLIGVDRRCVDTLIEASLGGDGSEPSPLASRPFSALDVRMVRLVLDHMAAALAESFLPISKVTLTHERTETRLDPQMLGVKPFDVIVARFVVRVFGEEAGMFIYLPAARLAQFRSQFERSSASTQAADPAWTNQLEVELGQSTVQLQAVLGVIHLTLSEISRLSVGQLIDLGVTHGSPVLLEGSGEPLFHCRLGQSNRHFVLTIEGDVPERNTFNPD